MKKSWKLFFIAIVWMKYMTFVCSNPPKAGKIKSFDHIIKSPYDDRSYRSLKLGNELKVILISDPSIEKAAVSMVVAVGSLNDFSGVDGLANLAGFTLTTSPDFETFLKQNGSTHTHIHRTHIDQQTFSFDINADQLAPALDRFAQFFLKPSLENLRIEDFSVALRALETVYENLKKNDAYRIDEVEKLLSKKKHKFNHFYIGHFEKCEWDRTRDRLATFSRQWYSANIMHLAILGKEDLDVQEKLVTPLFGNIRNRKTKLINYEYPDSHPWGPDELRHKVYVVPVNEKLQILRLKFPVPHRISPYSATPELYVSFMLTRTAPGTLTSVLRRKNLCTDLYTIHAVHAGIGFFTITCYLTSEGVTQVDDITDLIFQYLSLILSNGIDESLFNDMKKLNKLEQWYKDPIRKKPLEYVQFVSTGLRFYPADENFLLQLREQLGLWNASLVTEFLLHLTPESMNMTVVSRTFEETAQQTEKYFGTKYKIEEIPSELIDKWYASEMCKEFQIPSINKFLPEILESYRSQYEDEEMKHPYPIHESSSIEVWFKYGEKSEIPRLHLWFEISQPRSELDPLSKATWMLYWATIRMKLNYLLQDARDAGFKWTFTPSPNGMSVHSYGYSNTMPLFLEKLTTFLKISNVAFKREDFEYGKKMLMLALDDRDTKSFDSEASWFSSILFVAHEFSREALILATKLIEYENTRRFIFKLYSNVFIRAFVFGNTDREVAMDIANVLESKFQLKRQLLLQESVWPRTVQLERGSHFIFQSYRDERSDDNNFYYIYYQFGAEPNQLNGLLGSLLAEMIITWCAHILKSVYLLLAGCAELETNRILGIMIVTSTNASQSPAEVDKQMEKFLEITFGLLRTTSDEMFNEYKEKFMKRRIDESSSKPGSRYWNEILNQSYRFDRIEKELELINYVTLKHIMVFYKEHLHSLSQRRSRVTVHVPAKGADPKVTNDIPQEAIRVDDITDLKNKSILLPADNLNTMGRHPI